MKASRVAAFLSSVPLVVGASVGCSSQAAGSGCAGEWSIAAIESTTDAQSGSEIIGEEELEDLDSLGLQVHLSLLESGDAELDFLGDIEQGTWEERSNGCVVNLSGDQLSGSVEEEMLTVTDGETTLVFAPAGPAK